MRLPVRNKSVPIPLCAILQKVSMRFILNLTQRRVYVAHDVIPIREVAEIDGSGRLRGSRARAPALTPNSERNQGPSRFCCSPARLRGSRLSRRSARTARPDRRGAQQPSYDRGPEDFINRRILHFGSKTYEKRNPETQLCRILLFLRSSGSCMQAFVQHFGASCVPWL